MAAFWRITRLENQLPSDVSLDCIDPQTPMTATLHNDTDGTVDKVTFCYIPGYEPCDPSHGVLGILHNAGYTPADWDTECGF